MDPQDIEIDRKRARVANCERNLEDCRLKLAKLSQEFHFWRIELEAAVCDLHGVKQLNLVI